MVTAGQPTEEGCGVTHKISVVVFTVGTVLRVASNHHLVFYCLVFPL